MSCPMMNKKFLLNFVKTIAFLGIMGIFSFYPSDSFAANSIFTKALDTLYTTFTEARAVVYMTAGFGLIGVAFAAISGKLPWRWLAMVSVALFTLAMAEKIILYVTGAGTNTGITSSFSGEVGSGDFKIYIGNNNSNLDFNNLKQNDSSFRSSLTQ